MRVVVFLGPSLPLRDARLLLDGDYRPPARAGDVLRVVEEGAADVIALVDGRFGGAAAVWHKELLYALERGIPVWGAASMGALRAADLHPYGMVGVGEVFAWYRDGVIEDDGEVAVAHGPAETGFAPVSDALVDVRDDLQRAVAGGLVGEAVAAEVLATAAGMHYPRRSWQEVLRRARETGIDPAGCDALAGFVAARGPGRKARDTRELLGRLAAGPVPPPPPITISHTEYLEAMRHAQRLAIATGRREPPDSATLLPTGEPLAAAEERALLRVLVRRAARELGVQPTGADLAETRAALRADGPAADPDPADPDPEVVADRTLQRLVAAQLEAETRVLLPEEARQGPRWPVTPARSGTPARERPDALLRLAAALRSDAAG